MSRATKGKTFERRVAKALRCLDPKAKRCLQFQKEHGAPDVTAGPLWVECKARRVPVATVYEETAEAAKARKGAIPVVVSKTTAKGAVLLTMSLRDFLKLAPRLPKARVSGARRADPAVSRDSTESLHALRDLLLLASRKATLTTLRGWTMDERRAASDWAAKAYCAASDNPVRVPPMPAHVASLPEDR
jgi:hypothetical protein